MLLKSLIFTVLLLSFQSSLFSQGYSTIDKRTVFKIPDENNTYVTFQKFHNSSILQTEGPKYENDYAIGPEIPVTGLTGFYDYQTNGECKHYIYRFNSTTLHAVYMTASDSLNPNLTRRTKYAFSTNDGGTWQYVGEVPTIRSGFPSLTCKNEGSAVVGSHYQPGSYLAGFINIDAAPGVGVFTATQVPYNLLWPGVSRLSNGNILVVGSTYVGSAATDTIGAAVFNIPISTFTNFTKVRVDGVSHLNMRWTYASGPNGKALIVINPLSDVGGNFGEHRMFICHSTDNGVTWGTPVVLFNPSVIGGDTVVPFFGMDAVYDAAGNYYVAFNSTDPVGNFSSAKMWVIKNGGAPNLVASHIGTNAIPEAAETVLHADAGICTIDHPALGISSDGQFVFVSYSVQFQNDTINGFNKCHIYLSRGLISTMVFNIPIKVTNSGAGSYDERYPSINQVAPDLGGSNGLTVYLVYQKDSQPGSAAFNDGAPFSRASLMFRKIFDLANVSAINITSQEIPNKFSLSQNYPNPFNPETRIRFSITKRSEVTLKVYNSTGALVEVIAVNRQLSAGTYEADFNASRYASGVYFYSIEVLAEGKLAFIETKKMVLIK